jgi:hypothetical protein
MKGFLAQLAGRLPKQLDFSVDEAFEKNRTINAVLTIVITTTDIRGFWQADSVTDMRTDWRP